MFDVLFIYCTMVCVFGSPLIQMCQCWTTFKIYKRKILSSSSSKASEPLINSTYSFFPAPFTIHALHEIMKYRLLLSCICTLDVGLLMGRIALLSPTIIAWLLSH
jgi:hypothetical protein